MTDTAVSDATIQLLTNQAAEWDNYVRASPEATLYHCSGWKRIIEKSFGHQTYYLYASQHERIVGVLPLIFMKSLIFGRFLVSLPFLNYGGIAADSEAIRTQLLHEVVRIGQQERAEHIEFRHLADYDLGLPAKTSKVLMILDLPPTSDELWNRFKSKVRSQIRRPQKEGFTVASGQLDHLDHFYTIFAWKMRAHGTPVMPKGFFAHILTEFPNQSSIYTVYAQETPVATGFVMGFKQRLQIPWAASLREYDRFGSNMLLYWHILKDACEHGYTQFDFGRSTPNEGTYKFKKQWGAQPQQCYWHYWLASGDALPELNPDNPKFERVIRLWRKLPLPVTTWLGPHIVKYIP